MTSSAHVIDVDIRNFEQVVLQGSTQTPVLVDFWAAQSEPCKNLAQILETITIELGGAMVLAKVDADANPEVCQAFRIQSIPTVVLIIDGQPVDAFTGIKNDEEIRAFLATHNLITSGGSPLEKARELETAGELAQAVGLLAEWLEDHPKDSEVRVALARVLISAEDVEYAREIFGELTEEERESTEAKSVQARFDLLDNAGDVDGLRKEVEANPKDVGKRIEFGRALVAAGSTEDGLEEMLEAAMRDISFDDGAPRKALLEVFQALGHQDPLTLEFQQRLSVLLCS
ncbi:MAG: putative thioredoxin [Planctomycetota bacterium]|jgi:putative thioredoxin